MGRACYSGVYGAIQGFKRIFRVFRRGPIPFCIYECIDMTH